MERASAAGRCEPELPGDTCLDEGPLLLLEPVALLALLLLFSDAENLALAEGLEARLPRVYREEVT